MRARALITTLSMVAIAAAPTIATAAAPASASAATAASAASATGGTAAANASESSKTSSSAGGSGATSGSEPTIHAPITAPTPKLEYHGPIYQLVAGKIVPYVTPPPANTVLGSTGGEPVAFAAESRPQLLVPGSTAELIGGLAAAPEAAPRSVQNMIWAANKIIGKPYVYGGGHRSFKSFGYDCSGTVSFALHGASLIKIPMDSSEMMHWGGGGVGRWVTIFANGGHAYMTIAGLRLDTSPVDDPSNQNGPRWRPLRPANAGFLLRHPAGL